MKFSKIKSYAKVNLSLNVAKRLPSKFHKIESLVSFITLHDLINLRPIQSNNHKVYFKGKFAKGINTKNTIKKTNSKYSFSSIKKITSLYKISI